MSSLRKENIRIQVDGEWISQEVYVDEDTGLDVDPNTGKFRTREDSEELIAEVYSIGRVSLGKELETYNKWMKKGVKGDEDKGLFTKTTAGLVGQGAGGNHGSLNSHSTSTLGHGKNEDAKTDQERAMEFKELGNAALSKNDLRKAARMYTRGLRCDPSLAVLWSNRAEAHLRLQRYSNALDDARKASSLEGRSGASIKALYREATALRALGRISECVSIAQGVLDGSDNTYLSKMSQADVNAWNGLRNIGGSAASSGLVLSTNYIWRAATDVMAGDIVGYLPVVCLPAATFSAVLDSWTFSGKQKTSERSDIVDGKESDEASQRGTLIDPTVLHALKMYTRIRCTGSPCDSPFLLALPPLEPSSALRELHAEIMNYCEQKRKLSGAADESSRNQTTAEWVAASSTLSEEYVYLLALACVLGAKGASGCEGDHNRWKEQLPLSELIHTGKNDTSATSSTLGSLSAGQHTFALGSGLLTVSKNENGASLEGTLLSETCPNVVLEYTDSDVCTIKALQDIVRGDRLILVLV